MGSFIGHVLPGTLFLLVGVWHIWCSMVRYVASPKTFRVRVWNPVPGFDGRVKHLELYVISIGAFIDLCIELLIATQLRFFVGGILNSIYLNNFEHSGMLLMFLIFGVVTLLSERTRLGVVVMLCSWLSLFKIILYIIIKMNKLFVLLQFSIVGMLHLKFNMFHAI